jgi:hypothetical protein
MRPLGSLATGCPCISAPGGDDGDDEYGAFGERKLAGKMELLGENVPQRHFKKSNMTRPGLETTVQLTD